MRCESIESLSIPKIGFGTWRIGGSSSADSSKDTDGLKALRSALELGYTHFDTAEIYAGGHAEDLIGRAIREAGVPRESLFITSKVTPGHLRFNDVLRACEASLSRLAMDYLDLYLIHWPGPGAGLPDTFRALNRLVTEGKVSHLGVSNFNLKLLQESRMLSETPILTDQVPYSVSDRTYAQNGVLSYCQANDILLTAYSPVDEGRLRPGKALMSIALAHRATPYQIALAWLVSQRRVITIPMSQNPIHQRQNLEAAEIVLRESEIAQLA